MNMDLSGVSFMKADVTALDLNIPLKQGPQAINHYLSLDSLIFITQKNSSCWIVYPFFGITIFLFHDRIKTNQACISLCKSLSGAV